MTEKRVKNNPSLKKEILLETEALFLEYRTKLENIRAKLQEIADLQIELKVKKIWKRWFKRIKENCSANKKSKY